MAGRIYKSLPLSQEFKDAINGYCAENGLNFAEETRRYWAKRIGKPEFKNDVKMGRPRNDETD